MNETSTLKRYTFRCWQCEETYELTRPEIIAGQVIGDLECPFCGAEAVFDPEPYHKPVVDAIRGDAADEAARALALPDVLPTASPHLPGR